MRAKYFNSINKIYSGDSVNGLIGLEELFNVDEKNFKKEFKNYFGVSVDESLADFAQFFFSDNRNAANLLDINDEETTFKYSHIIQTNEGAKKVDDSFDFSEAKILTDGTLILPQPLNKENFKLKYIPKYFAINNSPYRYAGFDEQQNIHVYLPVDTSLNTEGIKINLYQFNFNKSVSLIKDRLTEMNEEFEQSRVNVNSEENLLKSGAIGTISLTLIDEWVQRGKATTTVRSDNYHTNFYKGDGVYLAKGSGNLVNIQYLGKIQLINDKIVGENIEMDLDEFAEKEGWSSWEAFTKGLPGEKPSQYAGQTLAKGRVENYYSITPVNVSETTGFEEFDKLPSVSPKPTMFYAGIGSRETPAEVQKEMQNIAKFLERLGFTLRSGGAQGADVAFERGTAKKEIFLGSKPAGITELKIAKAIHPAWNAMMLATAKRAVENNRDPEQAVQAVSNLMARNTNQIFGSDLNIPVDFVVCWTPDGAETTAERGRDTGGTGQAIDMASRKGIPVFNLAKEGSYERFLEYAKSLAEANNKGTTISNFIDDVLNNTTDNQPVSNTINIYAGTGENAELSNFAIRPFKHLNIDFASVEQAYQFYKSEFAPKNENNRAVASVIKDTTNGKRLKELGREFKGLDEKVWNNMNSTIMKALLRDSFEQNPDAAAKLLATGNAILTHTQDKTKWATEFPKLLMEVREELRGIITNKEPSVSNSEAIQKFLDEQFEIYLPQIQQMRGYKKVKTKEDFLNLPQEKQDSIIEKLCKS
jgi:ribA/ribD-fused uncharacterized protein